MAGSESLLRFEVRRKAVHILLTFYPLLFVAFGVARIYAIASYSVYFAFWIASELLRIRFGIETPTAFLIRKISRANMRGTFGKEWKRLRFPYWIVGSLIAIAFFSSSAIVAATVCLSFGDSASGLVKALTGTNGSAIATLVGVAVSAPIIFAWTGVLTVAVFAAVIGMSAEFIKSIDDNLTIPIFAAIASQAASVLQAVI
jgi:dolichol kinase